MQHHTWHKTTIGNLGRVVTGKTPPTKRKDFFGEDYPFITPTDINDISYTVITQRFLSNKGYDYLREALLPAGSVCFVCIASIGKMCITTRPSFTNQQINSVIVDTTRHDPKFVYYLLKHEARRIEAIAGGTATKIVNKSAFSDVEILVPNLPTERKIAAILSAYDDLIDNHIHHIKILREIAESIYHEWFIKFRYPGHENIEMIESEVGPIPEGWEVKRLGEIVELAYGKGLKSSVRKGGAIPVYGSGGIVGYHNESLVDGPGIIVGRKGNVGSVYWSQKDFYPIDTVFYVRKRNSDSLYYIYFNLRRQNFINSDAAVPGLNRNQAYLNLFIKPREETLKQFDRFIKPIFSQIENLKEKEGNIRRIRDLLLDKLISRELDVENLEINTEGLIYG